MIEFAVETTIPGTECDEFITYREATAYLDELCDEWDNAHPNEKSDRSWASRNNYYAAKCGEYFVAVVKADE